jgi:hypothetical protein
MCLGTANLLRTVMFAVKVKTMQNYAKNDIYHIIWPKAEEVKQSTCKLPFYRHCTEFLSCWPVTTKYLPRVPQCLSPAGEGVWSPNSDDRRKSLALCLLCPSVTGSSCSESALVHFWHFHDGIFFHCCKAEKIVPAGPTQQRAARPSQADRPSPPSGPSIGWQLPGTWR